ncbi:MAG: nucleoside triphosphate hydrolase [Actinotalea sp.]|nr:nucleoside triphosphate hydrolase [Actinotalea sp.]
MTPREPHAGALADLVAVMDRLRSPGGCPWDAEQTHASLAPYAVEEAFEVVEAIESGTRADLREELGDLLLQVVFHARVAVEHPTDPFDLDDVAAAIAAKLRRRHPHVFGDATVRDAAHVSARWDEIKAGEKPRTSVLDGVPVALPALARAQKVLARADRAGLGHLHAASAPEPARPGPPSEVRLPGEHSAAGAHEADLGERLLRTVAEAQRLGIDAEAALRASVRLLEERLRAAEQECPPS